MKLALIALSVCLLPATGAGGAKPRRLSLVITVTQGEHSRDSNSSTMSITLKGNQIHYVKSFSGYRASRRPAVDKNVDVRDEDLDHIRKLLVENDLLRSRSSVSPADRPGSYLEIDATIASGNKKSTLKLSGMREKAEKEILYTGLQALISLTEEIVNP